MQISPATSSALATRQSRCAGFTLLEMLVVLVILSLLVGLVAAHVGSGRESPAAFARDVASILRMSRAQAQRAGEDVRVDLDLRSRQILRDNVVVRRWRDNLRLTVNGSAAEASGDVYGVRFMGDGGSTGLSAVVESDKGSTAVVTVSWLTGEVRDERR